MEIKGIRQTTRGWEVSIQRNGQRKTALCKTKAAAKVRKAELEQLLVLEASSAQVFGTFTSTITLGEAADLSLADRWSNIASMDAVSSYLKQVLDFLGRDTKLSAIDRQDLLAMQKHFQASNKNRTVNKKLGIIHSIMVDALEDKLIEGLPKFPKKLEVRDLKDRVFSKEEEALFLEYFRQSGREEGADIFAWLLDTCARWSELYKLKTWDVDLTANRVTYEARKAKNLGSVPLTKRCQQIALKYRNRKQKSGRMFDVTYDTWKLWFNDAKHTLGIHDPKLTTHCTRHTCATRLAEGNMSLAMIMQYGGWTSLKSVRRYLHVQTDALLGCVEVLEG